MPIASRERRRADGPPQAEPEDGGLRPPFARSKADARSRGLFREGNVQRPSSDTSVTENAAVEQGDPI